MKRKREDDGADLREEESKRRHTECLETLANAFGPSQDIFLQLYLLCGSQRDPMALGCVSREWNAAYKQSLHTYFTIPLTHYLDGVERAYAAFSCKLAQPDALTKGAVHELSCPSLRTLPRHVGPVLCAGAIVRQWLRTLPDSVPAGLCKRIFLREFNDNSFAAMFPGFKRGRVWSWTSAGSESLVPISARPAHVVSIKIKRPGFTKWTFHIKSFL